MPKPRFSYTITLDDEEAKAIEEVAYDSRLTATAAVRKAFLDRLHLERAGWKIGGERIGTAVRAIVELNEMRLEKVIAFVGKL